MTPETKYLLFSVILTFVQMLIATTAAMLVVGLPTLAGNREKFEEMPGFAGRARRLHFNMVENMILFVPLVLVAVVAQKTNATTGMGALIFFWARVVHALIYLLGVPWLRTGAWAVSVVGMVMIAMQLL